jgi:WD40 repeat protein
MIRYTLILLTLLLILPASAQTGYWTAEPGGLVTAVDTTSDGRYVLAGTSRGGVALYAADSRDVVWSHRGGEVDASPVTAVVVSRGGAFSAAGHEDGNITFFEARLVLAAGSDQAYLYSTIGERQWAIRVERGVNSISMDGAGNYIAVGDAKGGIQLLGRQGNRLWSDFAHDAVTAVAVSKDGDLIAVGSLDDNLVLYKRQGTIPYLKVTGSDHRPCDVALCRVRGDGKQRERGAALGP